MTMTASHNSDPQDDIIDQDPIVSRLKPSTRRRLGVGASLVAAAGLTVGLMHTAEHHDAKPKAVPSASSTYPEFKAQYEKALKAELTSSYVGPVKLTSVENTGKIVIDKTVPEMPVKRGVINIRIGGAAINETTANSTNDPGYHYNTNPVEMVTLPDGKSVSGEAIQWTDRNSGDAVIEPLLSDFDKSKPVTVDYSVALGAYGLVPGDTEQTGSAAGPREIDTRYVAGTVAVTGQDGHITSVELIPRPEDVSAIQTTEGAWGTMDNSLDLLG